LRSHEPDLFRHQNFCRCGVKHKGVSHVRRGLMRLMVPARGALYQIMHGGYGVPFIKHQRCVFACIHSLARQCTLFLARSLSSSCQLVVCVQPLFAAVSAGRVGIVLTVVLEVHVTTRAPLTKCSLCHTVTLENREIGPRAVSRKTRPSLCQIITRLC
jgi:hypothetical protein